MNILFLLSLLSLCLLVQAKFEVVAGWPKIPDKISPLGACSGVAVHHSNLVFIAQRGNVAPPVIVFSKEGSCYFLKVRLICVTFMLSLLTVISVTLFH
jgi:hypothetical protein